VGAIGKGSVPACLRRFAVCATDAACSMRGGAAASTAAVVEVDEDEDVVVSPGAAALGAVVAAMPPTAATAAARSTHRAVRAAVLMVLPSDRPWSVATRLDA
jgi:hypothetical protein